VIASTNEISRKIFNSPAAFVPCILPSMKVILRPENFVFQQGKAHVDYRKRLNPMFTRKSLAAYLPVQQQIYKIHVDRWLADHAGKPTEYQFLARELNMHTSLAVFCGEYMPREVQEKISEEYLCLTKALQLVNFPIPLPGTNVYRAIQARKYIMSEIAKCAVLSRKKMSQPGAVATSMLDAWIESIIQEQAEWESNGRQGEAPPNFSEDELALTLLTFIFASQDASTSSLVW
jgi:C-22 sterol desaturase